MKGNTSSTIAVHCDESTAAINQWLTGELKHGRPSHPTLAKGNDAGLRSAKADNAVTSS
jgi:hypothetical protein